ncbi:prenyltransferase/squalene oxidase repeat-containing protein [Streptomyces flavofungini]|uniref:prenyltransferase/squalene oxidase repeat-containing protein n=1 Tax=Streptomyces flavofungini TaxID=68200 RepID=UPI003F5400C4
MGQGTGRVRSIRTRGIALLCAAATALGGGVLLLGPATPAAADPMSSCTRTKGAVVAVDFADWGGGVVRGCDATPTTGYDLLHEAGFSTEGTEHDGPAFICRLGHKKFNSGKQYPTPTQEKCKLTPPATAYWSYWIAPPGQDYWTYSPLGAMSQKPKNGSVEAWVFGATDPDGTSGGPTFTPAQVRAGGQTDPGDNPPDVKPGKVDLKGADAWLRGRLSDGDHVRDEGAENANLYQTAHTALALAATGGRSATLDRMKSYLAARTEEFAYPQGTDKAPSPLGAALLALLAESTEGDPHSFGGHNLAGDLGRSVCTTGGTADCVAKGDFPAVGDVETQALAVLALHRAGRKIPADAVARVAAHQCKDGGFSPTLMRDGDTCSYSDPATTPYATLALQQAGGHADAVAKARKNLRGAQLPTGAVAAYPGVTTGDVTATARSAQAMRLLGDTVRADAAVSWLSRQQTKSGGFGSDEGATDPAIFPTWAAAFAGARTSLAALTTKRPDQTKPPVDPTKPPVDPTGPPRPDPVKPPTSGVKPPWRAGEGPDLKKGTAYLTAGSRLKKGHYYENVAGTGFADYGLTIDGAYALAATGTNNNKLRGIVDFLDGEGKDASSGRRTVNDWTGVGTSHAAGGSIGKVAVLAQAVGRDPRDFSGHDLIAALGKAVCKKKSQGADRSCAAKGAYRYAPSVFSQSLAVIAQLRAGEKRAAAAPLTYLRSLQKSSGAWPSLIPPTGDSEVDSTAMAAMALDLAGDTRSEKAVTKALKWIASKQLRSGGFPGASGDSVNSAALAVQGLSLDAPKYKAQIKKARKFLARQQNRDGGFNVAAGGQRGSDVRASTQALGGAIGTSFGTLVRDLDGTRPQPPGSSSDDPSQAPGDGGSGDTDIVTPGGGPGDGTAGDSPTGPLASTGAQVTGLALAAVVLCLAGWRTLVVARRRGGLAGGSR